MARLGRRHAVVRRLPPIWIYVTGLAALAVGATVFMRSWEPLVADRAVPWWLLVVGFALGERLVLHLRLRRDNHSFSMSEIPLVAALFLASPLAAITAQAVANGVVLAFHRRQQPVKWAFNLSQFAVQTAVAFAVSRAILGTIDPIGPVGWSAAILGALAALAVADLMINGAILLSGGDITRSEIFTVFLLGSLGAILNSSLALVVVTLYAFDPQSVVLGLAPPVVLFFVYRAYVHEREEGERLEALYGATKALHASPQIEQALMVAVDTARSMVDSEYAEVFLFPSAEGAPAYRTSNGPGSDRRVMRPLTSQAVVAMHEMVEAVEAGLLTKSIRHEIDSGTLVIADAVAVPLVIAGETVGILFAANRLDDVSTFGPEDVRLLETVAAQVSVSLENGRLEHSLTELSTMKGRLEELVKSKDELVASVSHELRTPLTAVVGLAQELQQNRDGFSEAEAEELMGVIADQSSDLADMVDDLLVAARAEAGSLNLNTEPVRLADELVTLAARHPGPDGPAPIEFRDAVDSVIADRLRMRQILRNLLSNADRYGHGQVSIEVGRLGTKVYIAVLDNGPGVPEGSEETIFEAYQRAEGGVAHPLSIGLGLSVSRKLARLMGGELRYRRDGDVTRFEMILPGPIEVRALAS